MTDPSTIVCKPTSWFYLRAVGMLAMFAFLAGWFYKDAAVGYRNKNEVFLTEQNFAKASAEFEAQSKTGSLTPESWKAHAEKQSLVFDADAALLPKDFKQPKPWPPELHDHALMSKGQRAAWIAFSGPLGWSEKAPEKLMDQRTINEQWYFACGLSALSVYTLFILLRTMRRSIRVDDEKTITQEGKSVTHSALTQLDLRKWMTKGLAFASYTMPDGSSGKIRFDGMTYGGFKKEEGEPAEQMMQLVRKHFTGELIEYAPEDDGDNSEASTEQTTEKDPV